jgi:16S rRNA (uracil1498-N3)-methyltransferase
LRLKIGEDVSIIDPGGNEYQTSILSIERQQALLQVRSRCAASPQMYKLAVACAIPKRSLMDDIIDKLTQLGVDNIIPLITERVIVKMEESAASRLDRWSKIARSAAEQSQRRTLPDIPGVYDWQKVLEMSGDYDLRLIPTLTGASRPISTVLSGSRPSRILVLIGPEGDFSPREVDQALAAGFIPVSLGDTVLRVETAAIAIASYIRLSLLA